MFFACHCLNFVCESEGIKDDLLSSGTIPFNLESKRKINVDYDFKIEDFFQHKSSLLKKSIVSIAQTELIFKYPLSDEWTVYHCINCKMITHAKCSKTSEYLVDVRLQTNLEKINALKESENFSKTFGLLIRPEMLIQNENINIINNNNLDNNRQRPPAHIKNLTKNLIERLRKELEETNEKISRYTEQQTAIYNSFREIVEQEYQILVSLVNCVPEELKMLNAIENLATNKITIDTNIDNVPPVHQEQQQQPPPPSSLFTMKHQQLSSLETPPATPDSTPMSIGGSPIFRQQATIFGGLSGRNSITSNGGGNPVDSDCIFELEGMESYPVSISSANNISDVEETEDAEDALGELDGNYSQRMAARRPSDSIARSLPISIAPVQDGRFNLEDSDTELPDEKSVDIPASIKALARSVHGDTVFGDLPRPRFSKKI